MNMRGTAKTKAKLAELQVKTDESELIQTRRKYKTFLVGKEAQLNPKEKLNLDNNKELGVLKEQKANLSLQLSIAKSCCVKEEDLLLELGRLTRRHMKMKADIDLARKKIGELDSPVDQVTKSISSLKKTITANNNSLESRCTAGTESDLRRAESRLENVTKSFCMVLHENKKLQEEVKSLLKERKLFRKMWDYQMKRLNIGKKLVVDLVEYAELTHRDREEWVNKVSKLRAKALEMLSHRTLEMRDLQLQLDAHKKIKNFIGMKKKRRIVIDALLKERKACQKRDNIRMEMEQRFLKYAEMLAQIKAYAGTPNIHRIATNYIAREYENMGMFNMAIKLTDDMEGLSREIQRFTLHIHSSLEEDIKTAEGEIDEIKALEKELQIQTVEADKAEMCLNSRTIELKQIIKGVTSLFKMLKCDNSPVKQLLGATSTMHMFNINHYLLILETKFMDVVETKYLSNKGEEWRKTLHKKYCPGT